MDYLSYFWCGVFAFHLISIVYWAGGSLTVVQSDRKIFRNAKSLEEQTLRLNAFRRFYQITWHVAPIALLTGAALLGNMIYHNLPISWPYHVMAGIGLIMFVIFVFVSGSSLKKVSRSLRPDPEQINKIRQKTFAMGMWGILAVLMGAIAHYNL